MSRAPNNAYVCLFIYCSPPFSRTYTPSSNVHYYQNTSPTPESQMWSTTAASNEDYDRKSGALPDFQRLTTNFYPASGRTAHINYNASAVSFFHFKLWSLFQPFVKIPNIWNYSCVIDYFRFLGSFIHLLLMDFLAIYSYSIALEVYFFKLFFFFIIQLGRYMERTLWKWCSVLQCFTNK